jgi:hypothetical protein
MPGGGHGRGMWPWWMGGWGWLWLTLLVLVIVLLIVWFTRRRGPPGRAAVVTMRSGSWRNASREARSTVRSSKRGAERCGVGPRDIFAT